MVDLNKLLVSLIISPWKAMEGQECTTNIPINADLSYDHTTPQKIYSWSCYNSFVYFKYIFAHIFGGNFKDRNALNCKIGLPRASISLSITPFL